MIGLNNKTMTRVNTILLCTVMLWTLNINVISAQYGRKSKETYASKYGIKIVGGAILARGESSFIGNDKNQVIHEVSLKNTLPQFSMGFWGQKKFGWLYADANILYSQYGMNFNVTSYNENSSPVVEMTERFRYLDFQVMAGLHSEGFRFSVGPVMHLLLGHDSELVSLENYNQKLRKISYGFSGAIGYDIGNFCFDLKYDAAFRTIGDHIYYGNKKALFLETPDAITLTVAYALLQ